MKCWICRHGADEQKLAYNFTGELKETNRHKEKYPYPVFSHEIEKNRMILSLINKNEAPVKTRNFPGASRVTGKKN